MIEGYNGKIIINEGVNVFFETLGRFLSLYLNVGRVFILFPRIFPRLHCNEFIIFPS